MQESPVEKSTDDRGDRPPKPFRQRNSDSNILSGQTEEPLAHTEEVSVVCVDVLYVCVCV